MTIYCPLSEVLGIETTISILDIEDGFHDRNGEPLPPCNKGKKGLQIAWNKGLESPHKGKTYEEIHGEKKAILLKEKRRQQLLKHNPMLDSESRQKATKSLIEFYQTNGSPNKNKPKPEKTKKKISLSVKELWKNDDYRKNMSIKASKRMKGNTRTKGMMWVTNGITSKLVRPSEIPDGFYKGRVVLRKEIT